MATPLEGTERASGKLARVRYTHDAMIDQVLVNPAVSQRELALLFGFTEAWVSTVMNSDSFQKRLAERKTELVDPIVVKELNEKIDDLANISLAIIKEKLVQTKDTKLALATADLTVKALGFGARQQAPSVNVGFVVALPGQAPSSAQWAAHAQSQNPQVVDVEVTRVA